MEFLELIFANIATFIATFFTTVVKTFRFADVIDIAIVAYLIYKLIKLVRETRAGQLVKGFLLLALAYIVVFTLDLRTMGYLLKNLLTVGLTALVVVFQPELRRALEQMGRTKIGLGNIFSSDNEDVDSQRKRTQYAIEEICSCVDTLSRQEIGALIVLERRTKLGEIIKTGTIINADPSAELIGNVFFPNSPLHDGAMIVRDGRLYAAGCFLPISDNFTISKNLGTRHRAALGMSENSDAIVVVVSEETGVISIAENGVLVRDYTPATLKERLVKALLPPKSTELTERKAAFWKVKSK